MRKILCRALLCLCLVLALGPVHTAFAQDLDRIESYDVDVTPNTEDGSLRIQVTLEWTVLAEGPVSWVKIGVPNGSIRQEQALTDNIDRLSFDNSYMYVYFNRDYDDGETFRFSYSWIQEYMYTLGADGSVEYVYTPGWFSEARVGQMTLTWHDPAGVDGVDSLGNTGGDHAAVLTDLDHGQQLDFTVRYDSWPARLAQEGSRDNLPQDNDPGYDPGYDPDYQDDGLGLVGLVILLWWCSSSSGWRRPPTDIGAASAPTMCSSAACGIRQGPTDGPGPAPTVPGKSRNRPAAAASAAAAGEAASAVAASAAGDTAPAPAAAPVRAPAPVPAAAGPGAAPRTSMARCIWTRSLPGKWSNKKWRAPPAHAIFAIFMPPAPRSPRRRRSSRCRSYGRCGRTPLASTFLFMRCSILL